MESEETEERHFTRADRTSSEGEFAKKLLDRPARSEYQQMWKELLKREKLAKQEQEEHSILLFSLADHWLGIDTMFLNEVIESRPIHRVPHCRKDLLKGVVNLKGQLKLCISLEYLLGISTEQKELLQQKQTLTYHRMLAISRAKQLWIFCVDSVWGVVNYSTNRLIDPPVNISKSTACYLKGILPWRDKDVALLDEELLFESLRRMVP